MHANLAQELAALPRLTLVDLRARYALFFGEAARTDNKVWLVNALPGDCRPWPKATCPSRVREPGLSIHQTLCGLRGLP
jgi:hypothetical protein